MAKYMILFKSTESASELMANSTPEQIRASMNEWIVWKDNLPESVGFEWGMPLQTTCEVFSNKVQDGQSPVSGYATMEGDKTAVTEILMSHPHLKRNGASIDVLETLPMPGM